MLVKYMVLLNFEGNLLPESFELSTERVICQTELAQIIMNDIFLNTAHPSL
jgi:hypothetical protein